MASGRVYSASFTAVAITAQQDLIAIAVGSLKPIELLEFGLSQVTKVGDANETQVQILLKSGATVAGSGGTTAAPVPRNLSDTASGATCRVNDTTPAGTGTIVTDETWYWNVRVPFQRIFTPDTTKFIAANRLVIGLGTTITMTASGYAIFREFA